MACARLAASLSGGSADQRAAAYTELSALARGDAPDTTTGLSTATLHAGLVNSNRAVGKAHKLVVLSAGVASDAMFARQVRRKFV